MATNALGRSTRETNPPMWHGVAEHLLFVVLVAFALHAVSDRFLVCAVGGAAVCSVLNLVHEAWLADWQVNLGWGSPMFVIGALLALPFCLLAGPPILGLRHRRSRKR